MQCARSFCFAVYLYCIVHSSTSLPLSLYENESDKGPIIEIDSSKLNAAERSKNIVEDGSILARNKRNFDYSDYYSSSSEEDLLQRKKRNQISLDDIEDKEFDDSFPSRPLIVSKGYTTSQLSALPLTIDSNVTSENLESESSPKSKNEFIEFEIIPAFVQEFHPHYDDRHFSRRRQAANPYRNRLRVNNQFGREAYPPPPPYGYPPPPPPPHHGFYPGYGYYPPPPPPPHYGYYPPPPALPPPQYRPENQYYQTDLNSSTGTNASASYPYQPYTPENESQSNEQPNKNYSSDTNLRDNIYDIFGTTADAHPSYDIDVRIKN